MMNETLQTLSREQVFTQLYEDCFPSTAAFVRKNGGSLEDAKDVFHDALVIYYEKTVAGQTPVQNDSAYLHGIAKHLWYKKFKENNKETDLPETGFEAEDETEPPVSADIIHYIALSGKKCLELLTSFYYDQLNMKEIAMRFGFSGERSATAQKYKCLEKVRNAMRERSLTKSDFYE